MEFHFNTTEAPLNLSFNGSENATSRPELCGPYGFQFYLNSVVIGLMCILGLIGNTVSILVLQKDRHNRVAIFLLQSLAITHNCVLCTAFIVLSLALGILPVVDKSAESKLRPYALKYLNPLGNIAQSTVIWITVLLAINRFIAVCRPFSAKRWLTMGYARLQVAIVVLTCVLLNVPRVLMYRSIPPSDNEVTVNGSTVTLFPPFNKSALGFDDTFHLYYTQIFYTSFVYMLPLVLMLGFSIPLIWQMQKSKRRMKRNSLSYSGRQEDSITIVMIVIITELIICHSSDQIVKIFRHSLTKSEDLPSCPSAVWFAMNITNALVLANSSTDFIIYYVFRPRFRRILCHKLCRYQEGSTPSPVHSEAGNGNAIVRHDNGSLRRNSTKTRRKSPNDEEGPTFKPTLKERYKLTKKRDSNQILLIKLNNI